MKQKATLVFYFIAAAVNIYAAYTANETLNYYSKPILMPLLLAFLYNSTKGNVTGKTLLLAAALLFSWGGDIALMNPAEYFLLGVGLFFCAQLCYIWLFKNAVSQPGRLRLFPLALIIVYGIFILMQILPHAGNLTIPVSIYAISLLGMAYFAAYRHKVANNESFQQVLSGAVLFVVSDSLLAYNKFVEPVPNASVWIMATYILAQVLILSGVLVHQRQSA